MKENVIAMAMPWKALVTNALSVAIDVHALHVCFIFEIVGAYSKAFSFCSSTNSCHFSTNGALTSPGSHLATIVVA